MLTRSRRRRLSLTPQTSTGATTVSRLPSALLSLPDEMLYIILSASLCATLQAAAVSCKKLSRIGSEVATRAFPATRARLSEATPTPAEIARPIASLVEWERAAAMQRLRLTGSSLADATLGEHLDADTDPRLRFLQRWPDLSGYGHHTQSNGADELPGPILLDGPPVASAPAAGADGIRIVHFGMQQLPAGSLLIPFATPVAPPYTAMIIAAAQGDCTLLNFGTTPTAQVELCHGFVNEEHSLGPRVCLSTNYGNSSDSSETVNRFYGTSRSNGHWRAYTAVFDNTDAPSAISVDGDQEGQGSLEGRVPPIDGLILGADSEYEYPLAGAVAEVHFFEGRLPTPVSERLMAELTEHAAQLNAVTGPVPAHLDDLLDGEAEGEEH